MNICFYDGLFTPLTSFLINTTAIDLLLQAFGIRKETLRPILLSGLLPSRQLLGGPKHATVSRRRSAKSARIGDEVIRFSKSKNFHTLTYLQAAMLPVKNVSSPSFQ